MPSDETKKISVKRRSDDRAEHGNPPGLEEPAGGKMEVGAAPSKA